MSGNLPFGFTPPGDGDDSGGGSGGSGVPGPMGFGPGGFDMSQLGEALQQLGRMMASGGGDAGPVNWDLARDGARQHVAQEGDPSVNATERREVEAALDLASLWLDPATSFPATSSGGGAWSRSEWIEATLPQWKRIVEPVAVRANESMAGFMPTGGGLPEGLPPELAQMAGPIMGMAKQMGAMMFGTQLGQALGTLSGEVLGAADVGIPLTDDGRSFLLPRNVAAFGDGLGVPADEVRLYVALRETAAQRLFAHVPWLRSQLTAAVEAYAAGIHIDQDKIEEAARSVDPSDPASLQQAIASGVFVPDDTPEQKAALARLETLLALVEGWVDDVVSHAAAGRLPSADRLREAMRRRRATGGPAERTFETLVGLEMRPRRLREAAQLWDAIRESRGPEGRDELWGHPDLLPHAEDLDGDDAIAAFVERSKPLDLSELDATPPADDPQADGSDPEAPAS
jgi:putative hydrolase